MITKEPDGEYTLYRERRSGREIWAKRMPDDFRIETQAGTIDQRPAGAAHVAKRVGLLAGNVGDYLVIYDLGMGTRVPFPGDVFDSVFVVGTDPLQG